MSNRREFLKQLGLLSIAVGVDLQVIKLPGKSLLTVEQKAAVVHFFRNNLAFPMPGLPLGVQFLRRAEDEWGDGYGIALVVNRNGARVKNSVLWEVINTTDEHPIASAVDALVDWFDAHGNWMLQQSEARV